MSAILEHANNAYLLGNSSFTLNDYEAAIFGYSKAIELINVNPPNKSAAENTDLLVKCLLNRSQSYIKIRSYEDAIRDCSAVLSFDANNVKALLRRSMANEYLGNMKKALIDVEAVVTMIEQQATALVPSGKPIPESFAITALATHSRLKALVHQDELVMVKEGTPSGMISKEQVIRLFFMESLPSTVRLDEWVHCRLCVGNEFGLWNRKHMHPKCDDIEIICEIVPLAFQYENIIEASLESTSPTNKITRRNLDVRTLLNLKASPNSESLSQEPILFNEEGKVDINLLISASTDFQHQWKDTVVPIIIKFYLSSVLPSGANVVPILSLPINVTCGRVSSDHIVNNQLNHLSRICDNLYPSCIRRIDLLSNSDEFMMPSVLALECPGKLGIGGKVWDSTYVLLEYLGINNHLIKAQRVIELGSGTGMAGIGISHFTPAYVTITDVDEVVPLLQANVLLNTMVCTNSEVQKTLCNKYYVKEHFWGNPIGSLFTEEVQAYDIIIASDVVYDPIGYEPLISSIIAILQHSVAQNSPHGDSKPVCVLAHRHRHPEDSKFFSSLSARENVSLERISFTTGRQGIANKSEVRECNSSGDSKCSDLDDVEIYHISLT